MMALLVTVCLLLMLLSGLRRDWLVRRSRRARAALNDLRRALPLREYVLMVGEGLPQLEQACAAVAVSEAGEGVAEARLLDVIHLQARTLTPVMRERLRLCADVAALLDVAPSVTSLSEAELDLPQLRRAARADAWSRHLLTPLRHLRLHLLLLRWGLGLASGVLLGLRVPLRPCQRRRVAASGADFAHVARASVNAYAAVLRSPALLLGPPMEAPHGRASVVM